MSNGWFCMGCLEDFEGDTLDYYNKETGKVLCDKCKLKEVNNNG